MRPALVFVTTVIVFASLSYLVSRTRGEKPVAVPRSTTPALQAAPSPDSRRQEMEKKIGLYRGTILHDDKDVKLEVASRVLRRCNMGDVDAIELDLAHSKEKRMLLTLEAVDAADRFDPLAYSVTPQMLRSGFSHTFVFPRRSTSQTLGLYLCKDSRNERRCSTKPVADFNRLFQEYAEKNYPSDWLDAPDRTYFFQFVQVVGGEEIAFLDHSRATDESFAALPDYLRLNGAPEDVAHAEEIGKRIKELTRKAGSLPLQLGLQLVMRLPAHNLDSCAYGDEQ